MLFYDIETRSLIAQEHAAALQADAAAARRDPRLRRWLSERLIAAGLRLAPDKQPRPFPARTAAA